MIIHQILHPVDMPEVKVQIYIDTGVIFQYVVEAETKKS